MDTLKAHVLNQSSIGNIYMLMRQQSSHRQSDVAIMWLHTMSGFDVGEVLTLLICVLSIL